MKKLLTLAIVAVTAFALSTAAQAGLPQPGDLGLFFDAAGTQTGRSGVVAFVPFNIYVNAFSVPGGINAYEFGMVMPAGLIVSGTKDLSNAGATNFGGAGGPDNYIVGTGGICLEANLAVKALVTYNNVLALSVPANDTHICLGGSVPSSGPAIGLPAAPIYNTCIAPGDLRLFGSAYTGCAVINPVVSTPPIPAATASWGSVKAAY